MAYTFSNTQGDRTITVNDNQLDQTSYSLTLLGKNVTNYGERIAENTIRQLENFASPNQPNPTVKLVGQLWYDKTGEHLRVYTGDSAEKGFEELAFRPKLLHAMKADQKAWPSPRSWEMASNLFKCNLPIDIAIVKEQLQNLNPISMFIRKFQILKIF